MTSWVLKGIKAFDKLHIDIFASIESMMECCLHHWWIVCIFVIIGKKIIFHQIYFLKHLSRLIWNYSFKRCLISLNYFRSFPSWSSNFFLTEPYVWNYYICYCIICNNYISVLLLRRKNNSKKYLIENTINRFS